MTDEGDPLEQFVAALVSSHEHELEDRPGITARLRHEVAHRLAVREYARMAEVDSRSARRAVGRLERQLFTIDERSGGVIGPDRIESAALALTRRSLGVRDDTLVEQAEAVYAQIEALRRQFPLAWSWRRARGTAPADSDLHALEARLDVLETEHATIWTRWAGP